jgi:hypothetical protein
LTITSESSLTLGHDDLADERCQFDVGVVERLLNTPGIAYQLRSHPNEVAQTPPALARLKARGESPK